MYEYVLLKNLEVIGTGLSSHLSQVPNPTLVSQGFARATTDSANGNGASRGVPQAGGLHHRYERRTA